MDKPISVGWAQNDGSYRSVQKICKILPSGMYGLGIIDGVEYFDPINITSDNVIDLPGLPSKYLLEQIKTFWSRKDRYDEYGLLHKRGILMYGAAGCGKTSIINLLCRELIALDGVIFVVDDFTLASNCIQHFRTIEPDRPIMTLMEDIEGTFSGDAGNHQVKAALSFLDGQDQVDNITNVATTNQPESLADRFIKRPGRFDLIIGVHAPKRETREAYLRHVTGDKIPEEKLQELVEKTEGLSLAYLREIASTYLCLDIPLEETLERLKKNFRMHHLSVKKKERVGFSIGYDGGESNDSVSE